MYLEPEISKKGLSLKDKIRRYVMTHSTATVKQIQQYSHAKAETIRTILKQLQSDGVGSCVIATDGRNEGKVAGFTYRAKA